MKVAAVIPARMASTRFPGKPLAKIHGRQMIEHVYKRVQLSKYIDEIYLATCDDEIAEAVIDFKGKVIMTSAKHNRGTDRVAEASKKIEADIIINVQGDEPTVNPFELDKAIVEFKEKNISCLNLVTRIEDEDTFNSQNVVKAVIDNYNKILYFSRKPIPNQIGEFIYGIKQIGIYLIKKDLLLQYLQWQETKLEIIEQVDMLRFIENGHPIYAFESVNMIGVDTPDELNDVEKILLNDSIYLKYFK
jgi:3-deoxy-manno-octulosonate cytidylyltransferase (CMP-KDO synthetase)